MTFFGLSEKDAEASREKYGFNELLYKPSFGKNLLKGFGGMCCKLFVIAALAEVIAALAGLVFVPDFSAVFTRSGIMFGAAVLCGLAETALRHSSEQTLNKLCGSAADGKYTVFRDNGKTEKVSANMLAVGDAVFLSDGDAVPADGAVTEGLMTVDQSVFGVLGKAEKTAPPKGARTVGTLGINNPYYVYRGSVVCGGSGIIKIAAVGKNTRIGSKKGADPVFLSAEGYENISRIGAAAAVVAALAVLVYRVSGGMLSGDPINGAAHGISGAAAVLAVSCFCRKKLVCELSAAGCVKRLDKKKVRIKSPDVFNIAYKTDAVLSDRSGMIAEADRSEARLTFIDGNGKEYGDFKRLDKKLADMFRLAAVCTSSAAIASDGSVLGGSSADKALFDFIGRSISKNPVIKKQSAVRSDVENFLSGATVTVGGKLLTFVRGGAEILLERCSDSFAAGCKKQKITNKSALIKLAETLSLTGGKDVTAIAVSERGIKGGRLPSGGYTLIGLTAVRDKLYENVSEEAGRLEKSGAKIMIITAESRESAIYAAKSAGIKKTGGVILSSEQLAKMSDKELSDRFDDIKAVVRAVPSDRRRLIRAAHEKGLKICASAADAKAGRAAAEADWVIAASHCKTAVLSDVDAAAEDCGIKAVSDIISASRRYARICKTRIAFKIVCTIAAGVVLIFL